MKKTTIFLTTFLFLSIASHAQFNLNKIAKGAKDGANKILGNDDKSLSNDDVIAGLKEALTVGTNKSTESASKVDGYYQNPLILIPFPPEAEKVKNTVEDLGMEEQVKKFVLTLNRAAEEAAKEAAPIFLAAVKGMTIDDGFTILRGEDNAATTYLKDKTSAPLTDKFSPIVKKAIEKVEVTKYWNPIISTYNKVPLIKKMNPDLEEYVTQKALEGLFKLLEGEEKKIRTDPMARVSDLLKKVFG
jgi:hypothetical protein